VGLSPAQRRPQNPANPKNLLSGEQGGVFGLHQNLIRGNHGDDVPWANLGAELAPNANIEVDGADPHRIAGMLGIGNVIDAIDRTHRDTGVAPGANILIEDGKLLGKLFLFCHNRLPVRMNGRHPVERQYRLWS
jgi:hypothetical protein